MVSALDLQSRDPGSIPGRVGKVLGQDFWRTLPIVYESRSVSQAVRWPKLSSGSLVIRLSSGGLVRLKWGLYKGKPCADGDNPQGLNTFQLLHWKRAPLTTTTIHYHQETRNVTDVPPVKEGKRRTSQP